MSEPRGEESIRFARAFQPETRELQDWISAQMAIGSGTVVKSSTDYRVTGREMIVGVDCIAAPRSVILPPLNEGPLSCQVVIKKVDSTANAVTVVASFNETIDGVASKTISSQYGTLRIINAGTEWWVA